jgi:hypothetical protein
MEKVGKWTVTSACNLYLTGTYVMFCKFVMHSTGWTRTLTHKHRSTWDAQFVLQFCRSPRLASRNETSAEKDSINVRSLHLLCYRCCQVISLSFWVFSTVSTRWYSDEVLLFDGVDTSAPLFASLSGSLASPKAYTSTQRYMCVWLTTSNFEGDKIVYGFNATYKSSLGKSVAQWCVLGSPKVRIVVSPKLQLYTENWDTASNYYLAFAELNVSQVVSVSYFPLGEYCGFSLWSMDNQCVWAWVVRDMQSNKGTTVLRSSIAELELGSPPPG